MSNSSSPGSSGQIAWASCSRATPSGGWQAMNSSISQGLISPTEGFGHTWRPAYNTRGAPKQNTWTGTLLDSTGARLMGAGASELDVSSVRWAGSASPSRSSVSGGGWDEGGSGVAAKTGGARYAERITRTNRSS